MIETSKHLELYQWGSEKCRPSHGYGPAVRQHYLIHYIIDGCGQYHHNGQIYDLKPHDIFLIRPGEITYYEADANNPWHYIWVGFVGEGADDFIQQTALDSCPIKHLKKPEAVYYHMKAILEHASNINQSVYQSIGHFNLFIASLLDNMSTKDAIDYVSKAKDYVRMFYDRELSVESIADYLSLNRNYFSTLFKDQMHVSPQQYIINYRINKACELLTTDTNLSIGHVSRSVGYQDPLAFSKVFKRTVGLSPLAYKKAHLS